MDSETELHAVGTVVVAQNEKKKACADDAKFRVVLANVSNCQLLFSL